jgi:hypothetical protein
MELNNQSVVAEIEVLFDAYEKALVAGNLEVMADLFWTSENVTRFGANDYQRGSSDLARFRTDRGALPSARVLHDTHVVAFGDSAAVVTTLFRYPERSELGRQSQTWIRIRDKWQIVHAHVSQIPSSD